jgi:hypothetical protein
MNINAEWAPNQADPEPTDQELIQRAMARGYTEEVYISSDMCDLHLLIKPDTDTDGRFRAFCLEECEWLRVDGWLFLNSEMEIVPAN